MTGWVKTHEKNRFSGLQACPLSSGALCLLLREGSNVFTHTHTEVGVGRKRGKTGGGGEAAFVLALTLQTLTFVDY